MMSCGTYTVWRACTVLVVLLTSSALGELFAGGTGEPDDPYQIATAEQLMIGWRPDLLDRHYILANDINLDPILLGGYLPEQAVIAPVMSSEPGFQGNDFAGSFDGNGHTIRNLTIREREADFVGLFGRIGRTGVVRNLRIEGARICETYTDGLGRYRGALAGENLGRIIGCSAEVRISGWWATGGLVGRNTGQVVDCHASGEVAGRSWNTGGLVGHNKYGGIVVRCRSKCSVAALSNRRMCAGGLVGLNEGYVAASSAAGDVSGAGSNIGGLVGSNEYTGTIIGCCASGNVTVGDRSHGIGGLVGAMIRSTAMDCCAAGSVIAGASSDSLGALVGFNTADVVRSYATGKVSAGDGSEYIGGLIGKNLEGEVTASFWDVEASGLASSAAGTGLSMVQMQDPQTFLRAGWDFAGERENGTADLWLIPPGGGYPAPALLSDAHVPPALAGLGTSDDPYEIRTPEDLGAIWHHDPSRCYELTEDVSLAGITWKTALIPYFSGTLNGNEHIISSLTISGDDWLGLFIFLGPGGSVADLGVREACIAGKNTAGALAVFAGRNEGSITRCFATGRITASDGARYLGGVVSTNGTLLHGGRIVDCYAVVDISVQGRGEAIGGFVADNHSGVIHNCYAAGSILAGPGSADTGSLAGLQGKDGATTNSYFLTPGEADVPAQDAIGLPLTQEQMRRSASFLSWDFGETWMICEGSSYPHLRWENFQCDNGRSDDTQEDSAKQ